MHVCGCTCLTMRRSPFPLNGSVNRTKNPNLPFCATGSGLAGVGERHVCHPGRANTWAKTLWHLPRGTLRTVHCGIIRTHAHAHTNTHILCLFCMLLCKTFSMQVKTVVFRFCGKHFLCFDYKIPFSSPCDTIICLVI